MRSSTFFWRAVTDLIPNPVCKNHEPCPHPQPLSQTWERLALLGSAEGLARQDRGEPEAQDLAG